MKNYYLQVYKANSHVINSFSWVPIHKSEHLSSDKYLEHLRFKKIKKEFIFYINRLFIESNKRIFERQPFIHIFKDTHLIV